MKIGIITQKEFKLFNEYPLLFEYGESDYNLIIGYNLAKELNKNTSFLNNKINNNTYWVWSDEEKPTDSKKLTINIIKLIIEEIIKNTEYKVVDPIINKITKESIKNYFANKNINYYTKIDRMLFLYYEKEIFGFDLEVFKWMDWNIKELIDFKPLKPFLIDDKYLDLFTEKNKKYIPIFYSSLNRK